MLTTSTLFFLFVSYTAEVEWGFFRKESSSRRRRLATNATDQDKIGGGDNTDDDPNGKETNFDDNDIKDWDALHISNWNDGIPNTLENVPIQNLTVGETFMFLIHDEADNGICCYSRFGWMTLLSANREVIWKHNGMFSSKIKVFLRLSEDGTTFAVVDNANNAVATAQNSGTSS